MNISALMYFHVFYENNLLFRKYLYSIGFSLIILNQFFTILVHLIHLKLLKFIAARSNSIFFIRFMLECNVQLRDRIIMYIWCIIIYFVIYNKFAFFC